VKVCEIMTADPICCRPSDNIRHGARMMRDKEVVLIPVVSDSEGLVGVITDRDICCNFVTDGSDSDRETIQGYMTRKPITCLMNDEVDTCEQLMRQHAIHRIPVIDDKHRCVGVVCPSDLPESPEAVVSREFIRTLRAAVARNG
jgi:CBS domain-containing protein